VQPGCFLVSSRRRFPLHVLAAQPFVPYPMKDLFEVLASPPFSSSAAERSALFYVFRESPYPPLLFPSSAVGKLPSIPHIRTHRQKIIDGVRPGRPPSFPFFSFPGVRYLSISEYLVTVSLFPHTTTQLTPQNALIAGKVCIRTSDSTPQLIRRFPRDCRFLCNPPPSSPIPYKASRP